MMQKCKDLGCSIGHGEEVNFLVKLQIPETRETGYACDTCDLVWWLNNTEKITKIEQNSIEYVSKYFHKDFWHMMLNAPNMQKFESFNPSLGKFKPVVIDEEYKTFDNQERDNQVIYLLKNYFQTGKTNSCIQKNSIFVNRRVYFDKLEQAKRSIDLMRYWLDGDLEMKLPVGIRENWVRFSVVNPNRKSKLILPSNYPNAISREVWDYIKSANPEIQILNQQEEPIPRPEE
jgi:hypothetical protein